MTSEPYKKTIELDSQMDIVIDGANQFGMVIGAEKVAQDLAVLFRTIVGDNIFHLDMGFDFNAVTLNYSEQVIKDEITSTLDQYIYVKEIVSIVVISEDRTNRSVQVRIVVKMYTEEELTVSVVLE